jgi:hypothetical protein
LIRAVSGPAVPEPGGGAVRQWTIAVSAGYSLILAAGWLSALTAALPRLRLKAR